jgi:hypothetical protein
VLPRRVPQAGVARRQRDPSRAGRLVCPAEGHRQLESTEYPALSFGSSSNPGGLDRVKTEARLCLAKQITESYKKLPIADPKTGLSCQSIESRMFGRGRVNSFNTWHYDMQSIFFDQLIHAWRWTGDPELEKLLRPALELHLEYIRECFDPDDDGLMVLQDMPIGKEGDPETDLPTSPEASAQCELEKQNLIQQRWNHPSIIGWPNCRPRTAPAATYGRVAWSTLHSLH